MYSISEVTDRAQWDSIVDQMSGHPLQLWGWGQLKAKYNWRAHRLIVTQDGEAVAAAQVLSRKLPFPFKAVSHIPRGPSFKLDSANSRSEVTKLIAQFVKKNYGGVGITIETDLDATEAVEVPGAIESPNPILYPKTLILDLTQSADELLAKCTKTTRYDIRKGAKNNLDIHRAVSDEDVAAVLKTYRENADRAGFAIHSDQYYLDLHEFLAEDSFIVACFEEGEAIAFTWIARSSTTYFELYGGSTDRGRKLIANAPVKWFAIQEAQAQGALRFDLNGLLNDGISKFKRSFSHHENLLQPSFDLKFNPLYGVWNSLLPTAKKVLRKIRK